VQAQVGEGLSRFDLQLLVAHMTENRMLQRIIYRHTLLGIKD